MCGFWVNCFVWVQNPVAPTIEMIDRLIQQYGPVYCVRICGFGTQNNDSVICLVLSTSDGLEYIDSNEYNNNYLHINS